MSEQFKKQNVPTYTNIVYWRKRREGLPKLAIPVFGKVVVCATHNLWGMFKGRKIFPHSFIIQNHFILSIFKSDSMFII